MRGRDAVRRSRALIVLPVVGAALLGSGAAAASTPQRGATATPTAVAAKAKRGVLVISVGGVPTGSKPSVKLRGRGIKRRSATPRSTLRLRPGVYTVELARTKVRRTRGRIRRGAALVPSRRKGKLRVRVRAGRRARVRPLYGSIVNPGIRRLKTASVTAVQGNPTAPTAIVLKGRAPKRGGLLSISPSSRLPRGLLARVGDKAREGRKTRVAVSLVSPFDAVPVGEFSVPLSEGPPRAGASKAGCSPSESGISPVRSIKDERFEGSWNTVGAFGHDIKVGVRAKILFTVVVGAKATGGLGIECGISADAGLSGMAGPVPVTGGIGGELSASASAGATFTATGSIRMGIGVATYGSVATPDLDVSTPTFNLDTQKFAAAKASLGTNVFLGLGNTNVASLTGRFASSIDFTAQPDSCRWDATFGQAYIKAKIAKFDIDSPKTPPIATRNLWRRACGGQPAQQPQPAPQSEGPKTRAQLNWDTPTDVDLHVWDDQGNETYYRDQTAIPDAQLVEDIVPGYGPEYFQETGSFGRRYTYGVCQYDGDGANVSLVVTDPDGRQRTVTGTLAGVKDSTILDYGADGGGYRPDYEWCDR